MIDKIIRIAEITMWIILGLFVVGVAYIFLSYLISYIDLKPNSVGPTFAVYQTGDDTYFDINEDAKEYFTLQVKSDDEDRLNAAQTEEEKQDIRESLTGRCYITVLPLKETPEPMNVTIREINKVDNVPVETYSIELRLKSTNLAVNKLSANVCEEFMEVLNYEKFTEDISSANK